ncbi:MAG: ABC transporter permease [Planctomycetota bacterium]
MRVLRALDIKVLRDVARMRGQLLAIALVMACGIGVYLGMRGTMRSLDAARSSYYASERFGHVFAGLKRAPEHVADKLRAIPGVQRVQTRVVVEVTLDVPHMVEAAIGRLVSIPDRGRPVVNDLRLRSGRMPEPGRWDEVLVAEAFAEAHDFALGTKIGAVINGRHEMLKIVGTALSPEFTYVVGPGLLFQDDRRFGVIWMRRRSLAPAFDLEGAFNDVSLSLASDANIHEILQRVDGVLEPFGGIGAIARKDQVAGFFVENELKQLRTFAFLAPALFLAVAAFLLNVVIGRIVAGQREEIAALKAFGYRDGEVGLHFTKFIGLVIAAGCALGIALGAWIGAWMTRLYAEEVFRFPELPFAMGIRETLEGVGISVAAGALGTWAAIRRTVALPPAEGLRPEAPPVYRATLLERLGLWGALAPGARLVLRELERRPRRAALSVLGVAMATGLTIMNAFFFDSVAHMLNVHFGLTQREDVQLTLNEPRATAALSELEHLPGVIHAEPYRSVRVRLRAGLRAKNASITGIPADATLSTLLDDKLQRVPIPPGGLVLARKLAEILDVSTGDILRVEVLEGRRPVRDVKIARTVETFVGTPAHMELAALCRILGETESFNGAWLAVDDAETGRLHAVVKETPVIAGVTERDRALRAAREQIDEFLGTWVGISLAFSLVMAVGVLYNTVRITLAERARELASLRVLGFRRREVGAILLGEVALLVAVAIPLGLLLGRALAAILVSSPGYDTEQFRLPLVISPATYATAALTVIVAAIISGWSAWRKLDRVDIVEVLKSRD